jgi:hypothetical protein
LHTATVAGSGATVEQLLEGRAPLDGVAMESRARWRLVAATAFAVLWIYSICSVGHSPTRAVTPSLALLSAAAPPRGAVAHLAQ